MELAIHLKDINLYGYHGVHPLENQVGLEFTVNLSIYTKMSDNKLQLEDTIDYESVFHMLKKEFNITESLLENLAARIISKIENSYPLAQRVELMIMKNGAPIQNFQGKVGISIAHTIHQ